MNENESRNSIGDRLARIEQAMNDNTEWLRKIEKKLDAFIEKHANNCPAKAHTAYFKIIGAVVSLIVAGLIAALVKLFDN